MKVEHLDGVVVRDIFPQTGFTLEERDQHLRRIGFLASMLEKNGVFVIASFIASCQKSRDFTKNICSNYKEIYLSTSIEICEKRDTKGLYAKARSGKIKNFTCIDDPYEIPQKSFLEIDKNVFNINESVKLIIELIDI